MTEEEREKLVDKMVVAMSTHIPGDNVQSGDVFDAAIVSLAIAEEAISKDYRARIAELDALLKDCADELEARLDEDYKRSDGSIFPEHRSKYERDMAPVVAARAALNGEK
jgi:hypothetical protein